MEQVITPNRSFSFYLKQLHESREFFYFFLVRDIKLHYRHPLTTVAWIIIQPLTIVLILTNTLGKTSLQFSGAIPYAPFAFMGLLFWNYFTGSFSKTSSSLVTNRALITKIYFPRILIPAISVIVGLIDFVFVFVFFICLSLYFHIYPNLFSVVLLLPCIAIVVLTALGFGFLFAGLNAKYYDIRQIAPFLTGVFFFLTPVIYHIRIMPPKGYEPLMYLNPITGALDTARSIYFQTPLAYEGVFISGISAVILFIIGIIYFLHIEKELADII